MREHQAKRRNGWTAAAFAALFTIAGIGGADAQQQPISMKFRLDWVWQAPQSIWTLADQRGYFKEEGLNVTIDRGFGGLDNAAAISNGSYDILFGDISNVILFNSKNEGPPIVSVFNIYDAYLGTIITRKGNGINTPKDLEGKTIGAPQTTGGRTMFPAFAKANGIDASKVRWETIGIQLQDTMFAQGSFDAVASFVTTSLLNLKQVGVTEDKLTIFNFADYGVDVFGTGLVVRAEYAEKNPEAIRRFIKVTLRGLQAMLDNKEEAIESLKKRDPLLNTQIEIDRLNLMIDIALKRPSVRENGVGHVDPARLQRNIDTIASVFELPNKPKPETIYNGRFVPPKEQRMLKF
jgi:NitT/TauT family transport system substrate-binding protein